MSALEAQAADINEPSPLAEIEQRVQHAVKAAGLDTTTVQGRIATRSLVEEQIKAWTLDFKEGRRAFPLINSSALVDRAMRNLTGYGPLQPLLEDDDVWEICINAPDQIFVKSHSKPAGYHDEVFHDEAHVVRTLTRILDDASGAHRKFDPSQGLQDAQLANGARVHIVHSDVGRGNNTIVNIRKFTGVAIRSLDELVSRDMLSDEAARFLKFAVQARLSIVFAGAPGSGKTTMLSCCAAELDPALRVVVAEEVFEADIPLPNVAQMQTRPPRAERPEVDLRRLVAGFLRMAPDVAIVGEVRDKEALPLLLTLSSGVTGYTTVHAGSARQALSRLRFIAALSDSANELPLHALTNLVSEAVDIVVHCARIGGRNIVTEILAVEDLQSGPESGTFTTTSLFERATPDAPLRWTGNFLTRSAKSLASIGYYITGTARAEGDEFPWTE